MPKILFEGFRPGQGDGGRWIGVVDKPTRTGDISSPAADDFRKGPPPNVKPPKGGSAIQTTTGKK